MHTTDPAPHAGRRYEAIIIELRQHPGRWALLAENSSNSTLVRLRHRYQPLGYAFVGRGATKSGTVRKIYARYVGGIDVDVHWEDPEPSSQDLAHERALAAAAFVEAHPGLSVAELAARLGITTVTLNRYLKRAGTYIDRRTRK